MRAQQAEAQNNALGAALDCALIELGELVGQCATLHRRAAALSTELRRIQTRHADGAAPSAGTSGGGGSMGNMGGVVKPTNAVMATGSFTFTPMATGASFGGTTAALSAHEREAQAKAEWLAKLDRPLAPRLDVTLVNSLRR